MQEASTATGVLTEDLEIERLMDGDRVICERRLRKSSKNNPFYVQGVCDLCGEEDPRMNFAVYSFPEFKCSCCEGKHTVITKFCNKCTPLSAAWFYSAERYARNGAKEDLVKKFGKDYKDLLVKRAFQVAYKSALVGVGPYSKLE